MNVTDYRACRIFRALGNPLRDRLLIRLIMATATPGRLALEFLRLLPTRSRHLTILRKRDRVRFTPQSPIRLDSVTTDRIGSIRVEGDRFVHDILNTCASSDDASRTNSRHASR